MKQKLDKVRTLAIKLFEAGQTSKRSKPVYVWGDYDRGRKWNDLPSESVDLWDAVALAAIKQLKPTRRTTLLAADGPE